MINVFEDTPAEKEEYVLDMLKRGYGYSQIMKECHVSPSTISSVKKKYFGSESDDGSKNANQISKETRALKLFSQGKTLLDVAIELDIAADSVIVIYENFQRLRNMDAFISSYEQVKGNIQPYLHLFDLMNGLGMSPEQVAQQAVHGTNLPYLGNIRSNLSNEVQVLASQKQYLGRQLNDMQNQLERYIESLEIYHTECEMKRNELLDLDAQINSKKNFIQNFDNDEGYQKIKKESIQQTRSIIKNYRLLVAVTVSSALEALRRYPYSRELLYDLSIVGDNSTSQNSLMESHKTQLLQLTEQVQIEIVEQVTKMGISNIQEKTMNQSHRNFRSDEIL